MKESRARESDHANTVTAGDWCEGGGIDTWSSGSIIATNNLIVGNVLGPCGGAWRAGGGILLNASTGGITLENNTIAGNVASTTGMASRSGCSLTTTKRVRGHQFSGGYYEWEGTRYVPSWGGSMFEALMPTLLPVMLMKFV